MAHARTAEASQASARPRRSNSAIFFANPHVRGICGLLLMLLMPMLQPPHAGEEGLAVPVRMSQLRLPMRAPSQLHIDLPAGDYYVAPASLGYFGENNEFVYTSDVQRGLIYGYIRNDPAAPAGDTRGAVYVLEVSAPDDDDLFMDEYLGAIRERVDKQNLADNQLRIAREALDAEPQKSRRLAAQVLGFDAEDLRKGAFGAWVNQVLNDYPKLLPEMPAALADASSRQIELKRLFYQAQAAGLDQMLASFELQMTLARLPKPRIDSLLALGNAGTVKAGVTEQLKRLGESWTSRQKELQAELAQSQKWLDQHGGATVPDGQKAFGGLGLSAGQLPSVAAPAGDASAQLQRTAIDARVGVAQAELNQLSESFRLAEGLQRYIDKGGSGGESGIKLLSVPRSSFSLLSVEQLPDFALLQHLALDSGARLPTLLKLARGFEGLDNAAELRVAAMSDKTPLDARQREVAYGLLLTDRAQRQCVQLEGAAPANAKAQLGSDMFTQLSGVLADPGGSEMADSNLGYIAFMSWYTRLLQAAPPGAAPAQGAEQSDTPEVGRQALGGHGRQPGKPGAAQSTAHDSRAAARSRAKLPLRTMDAPPGHAPVSVDDGGSWN